MDAFDPNKDAQEVAVWMGSSGIPAEVCEVFEGRSPVLRQFVVFSLSMWILCICPLENEIDGTAFLELTETDIRGLVPKLGLVKKICRLQSTVSDDAFQCVKCHFEFLSFSPLPHILCNEEIHCMRVL